MSLALKKLSDQVIVITGASSGIGLATARAAAARGAKVVLAARNDDALTKIAEEIKARGGTAISVTADVGIPEDVQRIADTAIREYGGFDTWVNDAAVSIFGKLEEVSLEDHHQLFQTNFWGVVHGSLVALKHLKTRGGALINLGSEVSDVAVPIQGMYSTSKHAVKGFTDALRLELMSEKAPVSVTLVKPAAINTPFTANARNYMAEEPKLPPPVYHVQEVAAGILYAATHPIRDIYIGGGSRAMSILNRLFPWAMDLFSSSTMPQQQRRGEPARHSPGALYSPMVGGQTEGDHPGYVMKRSFYTRASMHPLLTSAFVVVGAVAATLLLKEE